MFSMLSTLCQYNARCGPLLDFIDDIDNVPHKNVIDTAMNSYGEMLIDFMMSASMCMLNGRNYTNNDFTCKDLSVVVYIIIPH